MGLPSRERGFRSIRILSGLPNADYVCTVNRRSRLTSFLCVALIDAIHCDFCRVLKRDASRTPVACAYLQLALIVVFKSKAHAACRKTNYDPDPD